MSQDFTLFKQRLEETGWNQEQISTILETALQSIYPKKYGLVWEEKPELISEELRNKLPYFKEIGEREICLADKNSPQHLLIEGDNYEALKLLQTTHRGEINVIYIDPPYNTGKEFVYNDKLVDKEDGYRHSKWLSFMHKRLLLAKELMSEDGVIFISIDDNEMAQLKLLCDELFGESNFVSCAIRQVKAGAGHDSKHLAVEHEYTLIYGKNKSLLQFNKKQIDVESDTKYKYSDSHVDRRGKYYLRDLQYKSSKAQPSSWKITCPDGELITSDSNGKVGHEWRWGQKKFEWGLNNDFIVFKKTKTGWKVYIKQYQFVDNDDVLRSRKVPYSAYMSFFNSEGTRELGNIFDKPVFSYPKPKDFIKHLLKLHLNSNSIILDFFAGSGTTGHAVLELNQEDEGNRQFILCTNNENNICEEITYERLKRVIEGYTTAKGKEVEGIPANLKYFKVDKLNKEANTDEDLSYLYMPYVLPLLQLKHNAFTFVAQGDGAVIYEKDGFRFGIASELATSSDFTLLSEHLKDFKGAKILYLFSTDTQSYPKYQQLSELEEIIQPIPREILNLLRGV